MKNSINPFRMDVAEVAGKNLTHLKLHKLTLEYSEFCEDNDLPLMSADEQSLVNLKEWQKWYILDFIERWEKAAEEE